MIIWLFLSLSSLYLRLLCQLWITFTILRWIAYDGLMPYLTYIEEGIL